MIQIYGTYKHHLFLFNVQQLNEYQWMFFCGKSGLHPLIADLMRLTLKTGISQTELCIL